MRNYFQATKFVQRTSRCSYSSSVSGGLSYYHRTEPEAFKYMTVGQLLKNAADKYGDKISLKTYMEKKQLTFRETLEKVRSVYLLKIQVLN